MLVGDWPPIPSLSADEFSFVSLPGTGALWLVFPLWEVNIDTTDLAPTLVKSEGDFKAPFFLTPPALFLF